VEERLRPAAYAVCRDEGKLLLARYVSPDGRQRHWTLPGGKIEHGEDPYDAVRREVTEETGYRVVVDRLLGIGSRSFVADWGRRVDLHTMGIFYAVHVVGGDLRHEVDGTTDLAAWVPAAQVASLERSAIIDIGLDLDRTRPASGHLETLPEAGGLLRR
jgi:ADP-ribose pyrophosphatase YjhB (NUDIX family)